MISYFGCCTGLLLAAQLFAGAYPAIATPTPPAPAPSLAGPLSKTQSRFVLSDYRITHQGAHTLTLTLAYGGDPAELPPLEELLNVIQRFLEDYPNEDDFWEIVNRNLVLNLASRYGGLDDIAVTLDVAPCGRFPHRRGTVVEWVSGELREHWYFSMPFPNQNDGAPVLVAADSDGWLPSPRQLWVTYDYAPPAADGENRYPDYEAVMDVIELSWVTHQAAPEDDFTQLAARQIAQTFPTLTAVQLGVK